jgi:hypothetical protein
VWGTSFGSAKHIPFRIEPELVKVAKDPIKAFRPERGDILHEDEPGSHFAKNSDVLTPES